MYTLNAIAPIIKSDSLNIVYLVKKLNNIAHTKHSVKSAIFAKSMFVNSFIRADWVIVFVSLTVVINIGDNIYENKYMDKYQAKKPVLIHIHGIKSFLSGRLLLCID